MKWFYITIVGSETGNYVAPGCDESEALMHARNELVQPVDVRSQTCEQIVGDEATKLFELAGVNPEELNDHTDCCKVVSDLADRGITCKTLSETVDGWRTPASEVAGQPSKGKGGKSGK